MKRLDGKTALITGAARGIGRAFAEAYVREGATVAIGDINIERARKSAGEIGPAAFAVEMDVTKQASIDAAVKAVEERQGGVDILINNAAVSIAASFEEMTSADFQRHIDVNLMGPVWTCRAAWPHMRAQGYGRIVNVTSGAMAGFAALTAYGTSKGGLWSFTRALSVEGAPHGIKVNAVNPGAFTRMIEAQQGESSSMLQFARANLPAEAVSPVVAYLAHEACPATGECIDSVGGEVRRVYLAQTPGFADRELTVETVAARWDEVMAGTADGLIGCAGFDTSTWDIKPYRPASAG